MSRNKNVKDIMVDVFDFPHIPYWFSIRQAVELLTRVKAGKEKAVVADVLLVFDEKYSYMGMVRNREIVIGLEPSMLKKFEWSGAGIEITRESTLVSEADFANLASSLFNGESKKEAEKQVHDIMFITHAHVAPEDSPAKAAYLMSHHNLTYLPVLENGKKLVGMVSMTTVFDWVCGVILS